MVMKVGLNNQIVFKSHNVVTKPDYKTNDSKEIKELGNVTPDYGVKTPQRFKKLGVTEFSGGLQLHSYKLANGYQVSIIPIEGAAATVKNYVNVGSMNETEDIKGISHFLEHMAFNGTIGNDNYLKLETGDSFKKVEKLGGWTNASTSYAVTDYVNSTPLLEEKDLEEQIKIIAAMNENSALTEEMIEKEKGPVCSEINMIMDDPATIANDQTVRTLFGIKSSADELIAGSTKHIKNLTREKVREYYEKYYTPDNMNLVITGDVNPDDVIKIVAKNFHSTRKSNNNKFEEKLTPLNQTVRKDFICDKSNSAYITLGFVGHNNNDAKSTVINDILSVYLTQTNVGLTKEYKNINASYYISCDKVSNNKNNPTYINYTAVCSEDNSEKALKIAFDKLSTLKAPDETKLENIKQTLLQQYKSLCEHSEYINSEIGNGILNGNLEYITNYENIIKNITSDDIQKYIDKHIDLNKVAVTVVHPKTTEENIKQNHLKASSLSFKGKREPINLDKADELTLNNNFKTVFFKTNNDNIDFTIVYDYPLQENRNPAVSKVLNSVLKMGTIQENEESFNKYLEENNLSLHSSCKKNFTVSGYSSYENFGKNINKAKELLYNPRITEETVEKAKRRIKDSLKRAEDTSRSLYVEYESKHNPYYTSKATLLEMIDKVTVDDVKNLHKYILNNSKGHIILNTPVKKDIKDIAIKHFESLEGVKPYQIENPEIYKENNETQVITKEKNVAQADIMESFKYKCDNTPREKALVNIMNTILTNSSIGVFTVLREKEHLAYRVSSGFNNIDDSGRVYCHILTTTDNKETGETSYDNVQKSINGFNRQIKALLNSAYTDEDLENAKRILKANLLINETTASKLNILDKGITTPEGISFYNEIYNEIDNITKEDIQEFAQKVFKNPPIYTIVASKDTLEANKDFFETL